MPSHALAQVPRRIQDIDELLIAHRLVGKGKKWARGTAGINRAAVVLLTSHLEGFIEDLFEEAFVKIYPGRNPARFIKFFNTPTCERIDDLYEALGLQKVTHAISFTPVSNAKVRKAIDSLVQLRHKIVHGKLERGYIADVRSWRAYLRSFAREMDAIVGRHLTSILGTPPW